MCKERVRERESSCFSRPLTLTSSCIFFLNLCPSPSFFPHSFFSVLDILFDYCCYALLTHQLHYYDLLFVTETAYTSQTSKHYTMIEEKRKGAKVSHHQMMIDENPVYCSWVSAWTDATSAHEIGKCRSQCVHTQFLRIWEDPFSLFATCSSHFHPIIITPYFLVFPRPVSFLAAG